MHEFHPQTKQRTLSLAQTLASYPSFSAKQSLLENILNYETLVDQYEKSSGEKYPSDLKTATLLRCAPQKIREFLQLTFRDDVTYLDMKEALLSHERITKGYSQESIINYLQEQVPEMMQTKQFRWKLTVFIIKEEKERIKERKERKEKEKDGGTTCGNLLVDAVVAKAVECSKEKETKEKENQKERKEESPNTKETASLEKARVQREILVLSAEAMIIGVVNARGK